jgi:hypothetical protein
VIHLSRFIAFCQRIIALCGKPVTRIVIQQRLVADAAVFQTTDPNSLKAARPPQQQRWRFETPSADVPRAPGGTTRTKLDIKTASFAIIAYLMITLKCLADNYLRCLYERKCGKFRDI